MVIAKNDANLAVKLHSWKILFPKKCSLWRTRTAFPAEICLFNT